MSRVTPRRLAVPPWSRIATVPPVACVREQQSTLCGFPRQRPPSWPDTTSPTHCPSGTEEIARPAESFLCVFWPRPLWRGLSLAVSSRSRPVKLSVRQKVRRPFDHEACAPESSAQTYTPPRCIRLHHTL